MPRGLRDFQARWESRFLDFSSSRLFHSPSAPRFVCCQSCAGRVVVAQPVWPMGQADGPIHVLMQCDGAALERAAPAHRFDLQVEVLKADRVIAIHRTLELQGEDQIQIAAATRNKRAGRLRWPPLKTTINLGPVALPQK